MNVKSKRVLITGADGFIGSHLAELLCRNGATVTALAQYNSFNDWGWLEGLSCLSNIQVVTGDIRDPHFCLDLIREIEVVYHLAALIPIPYSYRAPGSYIDTNITGTLNLCQAAVRHGVERFVQISTSEVYGTATYVPIDEKHPLCGQSPYSASKIGADAVALSFYYAFSLPVVVARPFNAYGPRQSSRAVIPTIISQLASGQDSVRLGSLNTTRDFSYVTDTCRGMTAIAGLDDAAGEVFNIGTGQEIAIGDLAATIGRLMNKTFRIEDDADRHRPEKSEVHRLLCDGRKLSGVSDFLPEVSLECGLTRTIEWFLDKNNLARYKTGIYNV
jgi:NAD dependent epimerase/dehydratase